MTTKDLCAVLALARLLVDDELTTERNVDGYYDVSRAGHIVGSVDDDVLAEFINKAPSLLVTTQVALVSGQGE
ncbi:MAG: hypothetical protein GEU98_12745 [Pseudonocardiaceae bacterium]|nr:hypothetical protein [Pseudonocardiaceae bacterium]